MGLVLSQDELNSIINSITQSASTNVWNQYGQTAQNFVPKLNNFNLTVTGTVNCPSFNPQAIRDNTKFIASFTSNVASAMRTALTSNTNTKIGEITTAVQNFLSRSGRPVDTETVVNMTNQVRQIILKNATDDKLNSTLDSASTITYGTNINGDIRLKGDITGDRCNMIPNIQSGMFADRLAKNISSDITSDPILTQIVTDIRPNTSLLKSSVPQEPAKKSLFQKYWWILLIVVVLIIIGVIIRMRQRSGPKKKD